MEQTHKDGQEGLSRAARYWDGNLDPRNLEPGDGGGATLDLGDEIEFARTPDLTAACRWLGGVADGTSWMMDLGAGLGANSFAIALTGFRVVAVDSSLARLRRLRRRADQAGCLDRLTAIVGSAEALPFAEGTVPAVYTRSVLIHTDLDRSAAELARVLAEGGRTALTEPQPLHPLATLYRLWLAPKAWRQITRYFDPQAQAIYIEALGGGARARVQPFYLFSFLAFVFQFGWPRKGLFRLTLALLNPMDRLLLRFLPSLGRWAWFGQIQGEKHRNAEFTEPSPGNKG